MSNLVNEFNDYRTKMNEVILSKDNLVIKRLWNLDTNTYAAGALDITTKELLGLVASMVLRCDDCIKYHLGKAHELKVPERSRNACRHFTLFNFLFCKSIYLGF